MRAFVPRSVLPRRRSPGSIDEIDGGRHSKSGRGSDPDQTKTIIETIPLLLHELEVKRLLDIPLGGFQVDE